MGQGCNSSCSTFFAKTPDTQIQYTGPAIPSLGICTNDLLSEVDAVLLQKVIDYSTGVGISIPSIDLTSCALFVNNIVCCGTCTDLPCLMQAYLTGMCTLYSSVTTIQSQIGALVGPYNIGCLQNLPTNPSLTQIIQELINEYCNLYGHFQTLQTTVSNLIANQGNTVGNFLLSAINSCQTGTVVKTGTGSSANIQLLGFCPLGSVIMYNSNSGSAGWWDSTGRGYNNTPACGWAYCNGQNGTVDMRGQIPAGVTNMATNAGLKSKVILTALNMNDNIGEDSHILSALESGLPAHSHVERADTVIINPGQNPTDNVLTFNTGGYNFGPTALSAALPAQNAHNNIPPVTGIFFIQRIA